MEEIEHVSASSIQLFLECQTKWYHTYVLGKRGEPSDAMRLGSEVHSCLEGYLLDRDGYVFPETVAAEIAQSGLEGLPSKDTTYFVELSLEKKLPIEGIFPFKGFIDLLIVHPNGEVEILDHKTTSNIKYRKSKNALKKNTQMVIYAYHVFHHHQGIDKVLITHNNLQTKGERLSKKVTVEVTREEITSLFEEILLTVEQMRSLSKKQIEETEQNRKYCFAFRKKCDFFEECRKSDITVLDNIFSSETNEPEKQEKEDNLMSTLYVGCRPLKKKAEPLDTVLSKMKSTIQNFELQPYGEGWNKLSVMLKEGDPPKGDFFILRESQEWQKLSNILIDKFDEIII
tara:strand:+ start:2001 stop:3029 length:1029 start_codon:yes stop_codon:yes gene_type:complete